MHYTPNNWYWIVADDDAAVYSSAGGNFVPVGDANYQAWLATGNMPTRIATEQELGAVLADLEIKPPPVPQAMLDFYRDRMSETFPLDVLAKVLLAMVNEIRGLQSQPPITMQQFRTYIKSKM